MTEAYLVATTKPWNIEQYERFVSRAAGEWHLVVDPRALTPELIERIKPRYVTQAKTRPPSFILFGTRVDLLPASYQRYLVNGLRREFDFGAVPVRLTLRPSRNPFDRE